MNRRSFISSVAIAGAVPITASVAVAAASSPQIAPLQIMRETPAASAGNSVSTTAQTKPVIH